MKIKKQNLFLSFAKFNEKQWLMIIASVASIVISVSFFDLNIGAKRGSIERIGTEMNSEKEGKQSPFQLLKEKVFNINDLDSKDESALEENTVFEDSGVGGGGSQESQTTSSQPGSNETTTTNPLVTNTPTPIGFSPTNAPTAIITATPTFTQTPTSTTQEFPEVTVSMSAQGSFNPGAAGTSWVKKIKEIPSNYNDYQVRGTYLSLTANRTYKVWLCDSGGGCSSSSQFEITTDSSGRVTFSAVLYGHNDDYVLNSIKVWQEYSGSLPPSDPTICPKVTISSDACLAGSF